MADDGKVCEQRLVLRLRVDHDGIVAYERTRVHKHGEQRQYVDPSAHRNPTSDGAL
jgi:hypothetical protein